MRILGFVFVALIVAIAIVALDHALPGSYLTKFLNEDFIETFAALAGFSIAAVIFLVGQVIVLEERHSFVFERTRNEIKDNAYFLLSSFVISLLLLIFRPELNGGGSLTQNLGFYIANTIILTVFGLAIFAIYEILHAVFALGRKQPPST